MCACCLVWIQSLAGLTASAATGSYVVVLSVSTRYTRSGICIGLQPRGARDARWPTRRCFTSRAGAAALLSVRARFLATLTLCALAIIIPRITFVADAKVALGVRGAAKCVFTDNRLNVDWMAPFTLQFVVVASLMGIVSALVLRDMDSYEVVSKGREYGSHD